MPPITRQRAHAEQQPPPPPSPSPPPPPPPPPNLDRLRHNLRTISENTGEACEELSRLPNLGDLIAGMQQQLVNMQQHLGHIREEQLATTTALTAMRQEMQQGFRSIGNSIDDKEVLTSAKQYNANPSEFIAIPQLSKGPLPITPPTTAVELFNLDAEDVNALCAYYGVPLVDNQSERSLRLALYLSVQSPPPAP